MGDSFQVQRERAANVKICAVIPSHNNADTIDAVVRALPDDVFALIIDDGSDVPIKPSRQNRGKAEALKAGFSAAAERGFTHAVTLDADGQHPPSMFAKFADMAQKYPDCIITGVRDFSSTSVPPKRRFMNKFSNFWFRFETSVDLSDTQCGYRCYPIAKVSALKTGVGGFAYEAELLVRAAWVGVRIIQLPIPVIYTPESLKASHYKPFKDTAKFSIMNAKLAFMAVFLPRVALKKISVKK